MNKNIATEWAEFERLILDPAQVSPVQRQEMRRAFYAGASSMFMLVNEANKDLDEEVFVMQMTFLCEELEQFGDLLQKGKV